MAKEGRVCGGVAEAPVLACRVGFCCVVVLFASGQVPFSGDLQAGLLGQ